MDPKLFISMIPDGTAEDVLRSVFEPFGEVLELVLLPKKGPFLNAFVRYFRTDSCDEAIAGLNGRLWLRGAVAPLSVKYAVYKPRKEFSNKLLPTSPNPMKMDSYKKECNGNVVEDEVSLHNLRNEANIPDTFADNSNSADESRLEGWSNRLNDLAKLVATYNKNSDSNNNPHQALRLGPLGGVRGELGIGYNVNDTSKVNRVSDLPYVPFDYEGSKTEDRSVTSILSTAKITNLNIAQELQSFQKLRQKEISALCNTIDELKEQLLQATNENITQAGQIKDLESKLKYSQIIHEQQEAHISLLTRRVKELESQEHAKRGITDLPSMIRLEKVDIWEPLPIMDDFQSVN